MKNFQVAVCDDEVFYIEDMCQYMRAYESEMDYQIEIKDYRSGKLLLDDMKRKNSTFDILFLDVDMPELSGLETAKRVRETNPDIVICFVTSFEEYAYKAYQIDALGYLVKPIKYMELKHLLNRCMIQLQYCKDKEQANDQYLELQVNKSKTIVAVEDILYIEKRRNQCIFHLEDKEAVIYDTLNHIYEKLDKKKFYYVHQGYIANFAQIKEVKPKVVCFGKNREIPISRKYYTIMREMYIDKINRLRAEMYD